MSAEAPVLTSSEQRRFAVCAAAGFFLAPGAWLLQVIVSETLSAQACDAGSVPRVRPIYPHLHAWLYGTSIAAIAIAAVCAALALHGFVFLARKQSAIKACSAGGDTSETPSRALEEVSRKRFLALCSALIGCGFVVGLVFTVLAEVFLTSCSQWH
ncbi:hypothetical protein [Caballeronia grimmiae]|uniref:hypothetical protein n=1 Tax=Caballeronia grimmiae TaxID=1071679 RepID=UPI0038BA9117